MKTFKRGMRLAMLVILAGILTVSCNKNNAEEMLQMVPKDSKAVVLVNLKSVAESFDGQTLQPMDIIKEILAEKSEKDLKNFEAIEKGMEYIDLSSAVVFESENEIYCVVGITKEDKFAEFLNSGNKLKFDKKEGCWQEADGKIILKDKRMWVSSKKINVSVIQKFANQNKEESFLEVAYSQEMLGSESQVNMIADIKGMLEDNVRGGEAMQIRMVMSMLFENPKYVAADYNSEKGRIDVNMKVLNDKCEPAKMAMTLNELPAAMLEAYPGNADFMLGISISPDVIKGLTEKFGNPSMGEMLKGFDGNILIGMNLKKMETSRDGIGIMMGYKSSEEAARMASTLGNRSTVIGNYLYYAEGMPTGETEIDKSKLIGSGLGMSITFKTLAEQPGCESLRDLKEFYMTLDKGKKTFEMKGALLTNNQKVNAMTTLLQVMKGMNVSRAASTLDEEYVEDSMGYEDDTMLIEEALDEF